MARKNSPGRDGRRPSSKDRRPPSKSGPGTGHGPRKRPTTGPGGPPARRKGVGARPPGQGRSHTHTQPQPQRARPGGSGPGYEPETESDKPQRLQKILAHAGLGSRRECEEYILQGRVTVDGKAVRELGTRVNAETSTIAVDGEKIRLEKMVYYAVNKPKGYVSTNDDPAGRPRVVDLLPEVLERVYSVGRLDEDSTGLMILTNDGELANRLAHPRYGVEKTYRALVAGTPSREILDKLTEGIWLSDGKVRAKRAKFAGSQGEATTIELVLAEGKKREIRRMLAKLGHKVMSLTRIAIGPVLLKGLASGEHRPLSRGEIEMLRKVAAGIDVAPPRSSEHRGRRESSRSTSPGPRQSSHQPGTASSENRAPRARSRKQEDRPRHDRDHAPRATRPMPGASMPGKPMPGARPVAGKPMPGKPMPGASPVAGKPMPGKLIPGMKPMPGKPATGQPGRHGPGPKRAGPPGKPGAKPVLTPVVPPKSAAPAPPLEQQAEMGKPPKTEGRPGRRIIGLHPKIAEEAGLSLSGRPSRKRPGVARRPPRKVFGVRRPGEGEDER